MKMKYRIKMTVRMHITQTETLLRGTRAANDNKEHKYKQPKIEIDAAADDEMH
jgi:hypothetical protein